MLINSMEDVKRAIDEKRIVVAKNVGVNNATVVLLSNVELTEDFLCKMTSRSLHQWNLALQHTTEQAQN